MQFRKLLPALALALAAAGPLAAPGAAAAQELRPNYASPRQEPRGDAQRIRPVREIIDMVRRQVGGEFVSVQRLEQSADPPFYILRWRYADERVEDLRVNAVTGRVMGR